MSLRSTRGVRQASLHVACLFGTTPASSNNGQSRPSHFSVPEPVLLAGFHEDIIPRMTHVVLALTP
eukprot:4618427-Amphidinium_carterae.1